MQQFQVPQFIDIENKVIGPLTLKQFFYLLIGGGTVLIFWRIFQAAIAALVSLPIAGFCVVLAFYKPQGRPFPIIVKSFFFYILKPRLYLWKKGPLLAPSPTKPLLREEKLAPRLTESKLQELSWSLDIHQKIKR